MKNYYFKQIVGFIGFLAIVTSSACGSGGSDEKNAGPSSQAAMSSTPVVASSLSSSLAVSSAVASALPSSSSVVASSIVANVSSTPVASASVSSMASSAPPAILSSASTAVSSSSISVSSISSSSTSVSLSSSSSSSVAVSLGAGGNHRVSKIEHDYDANGQIDARTIITYSDDAKTVTGEYEYLGDGTPDIYLHGVEGIMAKNEVVFSDSGQQLSFSMENTKADGSMMKIVFSYTYQDDGKLKQTIVELFNTTNISIPLDVVYTSGRISAFTDSNGLQPSQLFKYNADGTLDSREMVSGEMVMQRTEYIWRDDGQLESAHTKFLSSGLDPDLNEYLAVTYDASGDVDYFVQSNEQYPTTAEFNLTAKYTWDGDRITEIAFDPFSQGSFDSIETITWEEGACYNQYLPNSGIAVPNFVSSQSDVFVPGIFMLSPLCAQ